MKSWLGCARVLTVAATSVALTGPSAGAKADSGGIQGATYVGQGRLFRLTRTASK